MRISISSRAVHYISYLDQDGKIVERVVTPLAQVKEMVEMIESKGCMCLTVIKASMVGEPEVIYDDGEWYPMKKPAAGKLFPRS